MPEATPQDIFQAGVRHHEAGRLREAEEHYRRALAMKPDHADATTMLAVLASQTKRFDEAIELILRAISYAPDRAELHYNRALILAEAGRAEDAIEAYRQTIVLEPRLAEAHFNLGNLLAAQKRYGSAAEAFGAAVALKPKWVDAYNNLGTSLNSSGRPREAMEALMKALEINPNHARALMNVGIVCFGAKRLAEAAAAFRRAAAIDPNNSRILFNLGTTLGHQARSDEAIDCLTRATQLEPNFVDAHSNLGNALRDAGDMDGSLASYRRALQLKPDDVRVHSNIVYAVHFHPEYDAAAIFAELTQWDERHAQPLRGEILPPGNDRSPNRRLRIGYVSTEFWAQAEAHFVLPLLEGHDRKEFEIHCYSTGEQKDAITERHRKAADYWYEAGRMTDADLARKIRADGIDILVDLNMQMRYNRLLAFARKPAPIQVAWIAYPGGTGLRTMDYRFTDNLIDPPGSTEGIYCEESIALGDCWCAYDPLSDIPAAAARAPGPIRFGSLNNPCKINEPLLRLWAGAMRGVPDSQLLLLSNSQRQQKQIREFFQTEGIAGGRVAFTPTVPREEYLRSYDRIDIALDTLPYNGITTTCDAMWMGVPVVSLTGRTGCGRAGLSLLSAVGLRDFVAEGAEDFAPIAAKLAGDPARLANLRQTLRQTMANSLLMDGRAFARKVEGAYRRMWEKWCVVK
jgi:protein O-GlcNAc transferase